ncbi:hypothetical protein HPP92_003571 [Vanilla planifolia]|uniref:Uncharacterized protein n=1 Tax=Vanilla planifolia TaxID=51239 RepID=A0A835VJ30_VANPL|nr:hypothetical protein HPP92_003571 [Vanilla planifolia]
MTSMKGKKNNKKSRNHESMSLERMDDASGPVKSITDNEKPCLARSDEDENFLILEIETSSDSVVSSGNARKYTDTVNHAAPLMQSAKGACVMADGSAHNPSGEDGDESGNTHSKDIEMTTTKAQAKV